MSMLRSALDELRAEDVRLASDGELEADLGELQRAACMLESERLRRIEEVRHRQTYHLDGHLSMASWLAERLGVAWAAAARDVRTARALQDMPRTREALASGEVSAAAVQQLAQAQEAAPKEFAAQEANLVEAARTLTRPSWDG